MTTSENQSTESALVALGAKNGTLATKVRNGKISLADVVKEIVPTAPVATPAAIKVSLPAVITDKQRKALETLSEVYGKVVPTERRSLTSDEVKALYDEREVIDTILKFAEARKNEGIRTAVLNHLDVTLESDTSGEVGGDRDKDGHYLHAKKVPVDGTDKVFSWEVSEGSPTLSDKILKELDESGQIDHKLYLKITEPVRVINEQKLLLALSDTPEEVADLIQRAAVAGNKKGALYVRNQSA